MVSEKLPDPILVTRRPALMWLLDELRSEHTLAVDTESNSLYAYQEQVCLIQFSTKDKDYLVDPLSLDDLSPLAPVFDDPKIEKIFHAAEYDLICLGRDFGFEFNNLFDTMIAARILGREAIGLGAMLEKAFGVKLDKRFQRANWGQRPLPADLLDYARLDTHYLIALRDRLQSELVQSGMWPLAREDFDRLTLVVENLNGRSAQNGDKVDCWRISGSYDLEPKNAAVLLELCQYRDQVAQRINRPLFKVIGDKTLLAIAAELPQDFNELRELPGMSDRQVKRHGQQILKAVRDGMQSEPISPPKPLRPDERYLARLEGLRDWRKHTGRKMGVMSDVILPRDLLLDLAAQNPRTPEALANTLVDVPWRLAQFGGEILDVILTEDPV